MKIKPGPIKFKLDPNRAIEILSSSEDNESDDAISSNNDESADDDVISISSVEVISSDDENMEIDQSVDDDRPLDELVGPSRQSSTDREVSGDEVDLDKVRWASSSDDEFVDPCLELQDPNPMVPGNFSFLISD